MVTRSLLSSLLALFATITFGQPMVTVSVDGRKQIYSWNGDKLTFMKLEGDSVHYYYHGKLTAKYVLYKTSANKMCTAVDSLVYKYAGGKLFDVQASSKDILYYAPKNPQILISNVSHGLDAELSYLELILSGDMKNISYLNRRLQTEIGSQRIHFAKRIDISQIRGLGDGPFQQGSVIIDMSLHLLHKRLMRIILTTRDSVSRGAVTKYERVYTYDRQSRVTKIVTYILPKKVIESTTHITYK